MLKTIAYTLGLLLLLELLWELMLPEWFFANRTFRLYEMILVPFMVAWFIGAVVGLWIRSMKAFVIVTCIASIFAAATAYLAVRPIDSSSVPEDMEVIAELNDSDKIIMQASFNFRHNRMEIDTVVVQERFLFRRYMQDI